MQTELLSPAGDIEAAYSAFYFGADAVYLGLRQFSARAEAVNFSPEELDEITAFAHSHGKKVYVAVNTVMQESELPALLETLAVCEKCRVDAVIVQDWGVARLVKREFPSLVLHASTQMAVHNLAGALAMKRMRRFLMLTARYTGSTMLM
jgi:putative protease